MPSLSIRPLPNDQRQLIEAVHAHCEQLITSASDARYTYHNWTHTKNVARVANDLAGKEGLADVEYLELMIAVLFHDTGYYEERDSHEKIGATNASGFLSNYSLAEESEAHIEGLILETRLSKEPSTHASQILRDADLHYLGLEKGLAVAEQLRNEWEALDVRHLSEKEWLENNIEFFESHRFFTATAKTSFGPGKARNLQRLRSCLDAL